MSGLLDDSHPYALIAQMFAKAAHNSSLTFSRYRYVAQSTVDEREEFEVPSTAIDRDWTSSLIAGLPPGMEVSLHSRVKLSSGEVQHIPMIDFAGAVDDEDARTLAVLLREFGVPALELYASGRSFHGYGTSLLTEKAWSVFSATLLLANIPNRPHIVDCRWVGHRLRVGYGALRWSSNTPQYKHLPIHAKQIKLT